MQFLLLNKKLLNRNLSYLHDDGKVYKFICYRDSFNNIIYSYPNASGKELACHFKIDYSIDNVSHLYFIISFDSYIIYRMRLDIVDYSLYKNGYLNFFNNKKRFENLMPYFKNYIDEYNTHLNNSKIKQNLLTYDKIAPVIHYYWKTKTSNYQDFRFKIITDTYFEMYIHHHSKPNDYLDILEFNYFLDDIYIKKFHIDSKESFDEKIEEFYFNHNSDHKDEDFIDLDSLLSQEINGKVYVFKNENINKSSSYYTLNFIENFNENYLNVNVVSFKDKGTSELYFLDYKNNLIYKKSFDILIENDKLFFEAFILEHFLFLRHAVREDFIYDGVTFGTLPVTDENLELVKMMYY